MDKCAYQTAPEKPGATIAPSTPVTAGSISTLTGPGRQILRSPTTVSRKLGPIHIENERLLNECAACWPSRLW